MKVVIQRVKQASVEVDAKRVGQIRKGMLVLIGVDKADTAQDADTLAQKIINLRIFDDDKGKMNLSSLETKAEILVVSQFTLHADCTKGRRPSFDKAADPKKAEEFYNYFVDQLRTYNLRVETGIFKATMDVSLINDGPVTLIMDSKEADSS